MIIKKLDGTVVDMKDVKVGETVILHDPKHPELDREFTLSKKVELTPEERAAKRKG